MIKEQGKIQINLLFGGRTLIKSKCLNARKGVFDRLTYQWVNNSRKKNSQNNEQKDFIMLESD